ncbi:MAG: hypothetical protein P8Y70_05045 [Candidatus Lokiarchaeota archaeon]
MEVLELKPIKDKKIIAFITKKQRKDFPNNDLTVLKQFIEEKDIKYITLDFDINIKNFKDSNFAKTLDNLNVPYYQVDIPEYVLGYLYEEILEKENLFKELVEEYKNLEDKKSYKGLSLKNWISLVKSEIEEKENMLSLKIRPQWIVKKMLSIAKSFTDTQVSFIHFVQEDICEDICSEITSQLRDLNVKVVQYTKKHNIKHIIL